MIKKLVFFLQSITIILMPAYIFRFYIEDTKFSYFFIPTTVFEIILLLTIFATFLEFTIAGFPFKKLKTKFDFPIILFLGSSIIALFTSYNFIGGLGIFRAYFLEPILFFYCLVYKSNDSGSGFIYKSLIISGFWLSILGLLQKITGSYSLAPGEIAQGRISAVYNSANALALFLSPISIITLIFLLTKKTKSIYAVLFAFYLFIIFWTRSRGGIIAETISLLILFYAVSVFRNKVLKKVWLFLPLILMLVILLSSYRIYKTFNFIPADYGQPYTLGDTLQIRYFIWGGTINMLQEHPIFGAGLNGFKTLYTNQYRLKQYQEEFQYPHNLFLTFWAETGILGLFSFILLVVCITRVIIEKILSEKSPIIGAGFLAIFCYLIIHGMVDVPYFKNDLSVEFWVIIALVESWSRSTRFKGKE